MTQYDLRWSSVFDKNRQIIATGIYMLTAVLGYTIAYLLRFDFAWPQSYTVTFLVTAPILLAIRIGFVRLFRLSTGRWRFVGTSDVLRLAAATASGSLLFFLIAAVLPLSPGVPRSVILLDWVLTSYLTAGAWIGYRVGFEQLRHYKSGVNQSIKKVLIVGAGEAGSMLVREMTRYPTGYRPIGFVDDDPLKWHTHVHGVEVVGGVSDLPKLVAHLAPHEIILALPSADPEELRRVVAACEGTDLPFKVLPGIREVLAGNIQIQHIRDIRIEDLLGREPVQLELPELAQDLQDQSILITGAAGSIGSELARQIARHSPSMLILLDQAETDLFYLELELQQLHPELRTVPVVADILDGSALDQVFREYRPSRIFHAAAYKHVPMMEMNPREAVRNNVIGTWRVAETAGQYGAEKFVLVSTDKAVRPVSVMGATKRLAEIVVLELQERYLATSFTSVRFGNVLGSKGSVIPIFRKQLAAGQPLTVTHPDATRYFMTIPEAVQLILQASLLPSLRGQIALLEMGDPVKIVDLAHNLLRLSGVRKAGNVVFSGLRPGERVHEELVAPNEETIQTSIPKVRLVVTNSDAHSSVLQQIPEWDAESQNGGDTFVWNALGIVYSGIGVGRPSTEPRTPDTGRRPIEIRLTS